MNREASYSNSIIGYETIIANRLSIMEKIRLLHPYLICKHGSHMTNIPKADWSSM